MSPGPIQQWAEEVDWSRRVNSLCKPCWELKYCPYGPLVESFPVSDTRSEKSCRIFGHDCPVFYAAEPFTETKELRRISRHVPRDIQFKVLRRDNQICQVCGKNVLDEDIEFDHIIPFSKGGPTEEHNIRLLCSDCNKKKRTDFEAEHLVDSFSELITDPVSVKFVLALLDAVQFYHDFRAQHDEDPSAEQYKAHYNVQNVDDISDVIKETVAKIVSIFDSPTPDVFESSSDAMKYRWGFKDGHTHSIHDTLSENHLNETDLFEAEIRLVNSVGWFVEKRTSEYKKWKKF